MAWIERRRASERPAAVTLPQARRLAGLTQQEMAERMGISQSDVSKLKRRAEVRLSSSG